MCVCACEQIFLFNRSVSLGIPSVAVTWPNSLVTQS